MHYPKITIVTPSFNQGQYIEQTIQSVINQKYPNLEYFVIDGGSEDQTQEILQKYSPYISKWISEADQGQSEAINKGLSMASGEIMSWLNADDYYEKDTLWKVAKTFNQTQAKVAYGQCRVLKNNQSKVICTDVYNNNLTKTIGWARVDQPATFYHHSAIKRIGLLNTQLHYIMDRDWWIRYLLLFGLNHIEKIPQILVNFRVHAQSKTYKRAPFFQIERNEYFWALANYYGLEEEANFLARLEPLAQTFKGIQFPDQPLTDLGKVLQYYFLLRADESYVRNQFCETRLFLKKINPEILASKDKRTWNKLKWRSSFPLSSLVYLLKKMRKIYY